MGGANAGFSGKRAFLEAHHYDEVWGWERWGQQQRAPASRNEWGLHDTDLLDAALRKVTALDAAGTTFQLSVLTLNTHPPGYLAPTCAPYQVNEPMLNAIHCTDQALGAFFDGLETEGVLDNTVVIVMGDHVSFPTPENQAAQGADVVPGWFGKTLMMFLAPGRGAARVNNAWYTPDVAPTALALLGWRPIPAFKVGRSMSDAHLDRRVLVSLRYSLVDGEMFPSNPSQGGGCHADEFARSVITQTAMLSDCDRLRILSAVEGSSVVLQ